MKLAILVPLLASIALDVPAQSATRFDGNWWQKADESERSGFLYGLEDCYAIDATPKMIFDDTWVNYRKSISAFYDLPTKRTEPVAQVFKQLGRKQSSEEHAGMSQEQRYGSEFWRGSSDAARRGFLEAYITCPPHPKHKLSLSKLALYVQRLNEMYNADDKRGEDAPAFAGPVADALELAGK